LIAATLPIAAPWFGSLASGCYGFSNAHWALNQVDTSWEHGKDAMCVDKQYASVDKPAAHCIRHLTGLSEAQGFERSVIQVSGPVPVRSDV
jgi:hypothetical protein